MPQPLVWAALQLPIDSGGALWLTTSLVGVIIGAAILAPGGVGGVVKNGRERVRSFLAEHSRLVEKAKDISNQDGASGHGASTLPMGCWLEDEGSQLRGPSRSAGRVHAARQVGGEDAGGNPRKDRT